MAITDTSILDWGVTEALNAPTDALLIIRDLPGHFRNIKGVARAESIDKDKERPGASVSSNWSIAVTTSKTYTVTITTAQAERFTTGQKIYFYTNGILVSIGVITARTIGPPTILSVSAMRSWPLNDDGSLIAAADEIRIGIDHIGAPSIGQRWWTGRFTVSGGSAKTTEVITFQDLTAIAKDIPIGVEYDVFFQVLDDSTCPTPGDFRITKIVKTASDVTITFNEPLDASEDPVISFSLHARRWW